MTDDFTNRVVLITGASSGIGRALAQALAERGATLVLAGTDADKLRAVQMELAGNGGASFALAGDLCDPDHVAQLAETAFAETGRVDALVNNAGVYPVTDSLSLSLAEWNRVIDTNLRAPFLLTQAVARRMISSGIAGRIVNVSSTASTLARPGIVHYGASKAGLNQLTRILAVELAPHGIAVNAVLPGVIGTDTVLERIREPAAQQENAAKLARIPAGRLGEPAEVVSVILFLLSAAASYCTGGLYPVDGGYTLGIPRYT